MNESDLINDITRLNKRITTDRDTIKCLKQSLAEIVCPFKIGDKVIDRNNRIAIVGRISPSDNFKKYRCYARQYGKNFKAPFKQPTELYENDYWKLIPTENDK